MKIKMVKTHSGSHNGLHVRTYEKGEEHEVPSEHMSHELAKTFLDLGVAEKLDEEREEKKSPPGPSEYKKTSK